MVKKDGAGAAAGLCEGDLVLQVDDVKIDAAGRPLAMASGAIRTASGPEITLRVRRAAGVADESAAGARQEPQAAAAGTNVQVEDPAAAAGSAADAKETALAEEPRVSEQGGATSEPDAADVHLSELPASEVIDHTQPSAPGENVALDMPGESSTDDVPAPSKLVRKPTLPPKPRLQAKTKNAAGISRARDAAPAEAEPEEEANEGASQPEDMSKVETASPRFLVRGIHFESLCGTRHGDVNQDAAFHTTIEVPGHGRAQVAAVFDGHGLLGEVAAEVAVKALEGLTSTLAWEEVVSAPEAFMTALFEQLNAAVLEAHDSPPAQYSYTSGSTTLHFELKKDADPTLGAMYVCPEHDYMPPRPIDFGCTAVVAVCLGQTMVVGNAGDAGGLLLRQNQPDCEDRDGYAVTFFTGKHTASSEAEQARIDRDFPNAAIFTPDGYLAPTDPVLSQYEVQLTRSLGHRLLRQAGVTADPDCFATTLDEVQSFALVICSDGVTDELSEGDILDRVTAAADAKDAAMTLVKDAQNYCMDPDKIDDTTALVVLFGPEE